MISLGTFREQSFGAALRGLVPEQVRAHRYGPVFLASAFVAVFSLLLGGGTRPGFLSDAILQLLAIPALMIALWPLIDVLRDNADARNRARWPLRLCLAVVMLPLVQLIPLPPWIWTNLSGREGMTQVFDLLGGARPWLPISVSPNATWLSFISLLPPAAIFVGVIQLGYRDRRTLSVILVAAGFVSAFLGLIQVAQGPGSNLRFFSFTNLGEAVGFFANRNHFAALIYVLLLFAAAWAVDVAIGAGSWKQVKRFEPGLLLALAAGFIVPVVFIGAEAMARSRAGLALTMVALAAAFAFAIPDRGDTPAQASETRKSSKFLFGAIAFALMLVVQFALYRILDRFGADPLADARIGFARDTLQAALSFMPFGSGMGTFVPVYGMFEQPRYVLANVYANHAHNDFLELWLESGALGIAVVVGFVIWFLLRSAKIWRKQPAGSRRMDVYLARAATMVVVLLAAHSFVDYPLRTAAIMAIFAVTCALLVEPLGGAAVEVEAVGRSGERAARQYSARAVAGVLQSQGNAVSAPAPASVVKSPPQAGPRWGEGIEWPKEWSNPGSEDRSGGSGAS
jgi:O-antigen ligase